MEIVVAFILYPTGIWSQIFPAKLVPGEEDVLAKGRLVTTMTEQNKVTIDNFFLTDKAQTEFTFLLHKEWKVSFELWPIGFPNKTASIVHLTTSKEGSRWASCGSRSPAIFFHKSKGLLVQATIDDNLNWGGYIQEAKIPLNR